jgi:hypothetical protein
MVKFTATDHGPGIPADKVERTEEGQGSAFSFNVPVAEQPATVQP